jgi:surface antigen Omp85-like protein
MRKQHNWWLSLMLAAHVGVAVAGPAETDKEPTGSIGPTDETPYSLIPRSTEKSGSDASKKGEWVIAPIPGHNPSQGITLVGVAQYIFKPEGQSNGTPPTTVGLAGLYTEEKSWAAGFGYRGSLRDDDWRLQAFAGTGQYNFDFYGVGQDAGERGVHIPLEQKFKAGQLQATKRIAQGLYFGPRITTYQMHLSAGSVNLPDYGEFQPQIGGDINGAGLGARLAWDTRDNTFAPTAGVSVQSRLDWYRRSFGGDFDYEVFDAEYNHYYLLRPAQVLAWRAYLRHASDNAPFFELSSLGGSDLRGYEHGRYSDATLLAVQAEWRWQWRPRWGLVAFGGVGAVGPSIGKVLESDALWSGGVGVRFRIAQDNPVNFRLDWAYGRDGSALYLSVGEAF